MHHATDLTTGVPTSPWFKKLLVSIGARLGTNTIKRLNSILNYLEVGNWIKTQGYVFSNRFKSRTDVYDLLIAKAKGKKIVYLEFGVASGASFRYWTEKLKNENALLYGFDTFEGLPEAWGAMEKGTFSTGGTTPRIDAPNVKFVKGLFQDTLPSFDLPQHEILVLNVDCDIYSGAAFVLTSLAPYIKPGTLVYFDEFADRSNELKAFKDFLSSTGKRFSLVGTTTVFHQIAFECIA